MRLLAIGLMLSASAAAAPVVLTLAQVQQEAVSHSPSLREQESRLREARFKVDEAYTPAYPTLSLNASGSRLTPPVEVALGGRIIPIQPEYNYSTGLSLRQTLLTFGRLEWAAAASELSEKASRAELQERHRRVREEAALAYYETLLSQEQVRIAEDQLTARRAHLEDARKLVKAGAAAPFDVKRDLAAEAQAEQNLLESRNRAGLARIRLFTLLDRPDQGEELQTGQSLPSPPAAPEEKELLQRRSDLAASRWAMDAARARVELSEAQNQPSLGLQTDYLLRNPTGFAPAAQWTVGLNLQVPLYDGGLTEARAGQAREVVKQLEALYDQACRNAHVELESLKLELQTRFRRLEVTERNLNAAQEAHRIARLRYQNGLSTNVELLDTQAALTQAQQDQVAARYLYLQSLARWTRASAEEEIQP